jgi:hypothetical protein
MRKILPIGPEDKSIVIDEDNSVLFTDFSPAKEPSPKTKLHLLDVIDSTEQDVLRLISRALDDPGEEMKGVIIFRSERRLVRVIHLEPPGGPRRTHVVIGPVRSRNRDASVLTRRLIERSSAAARLVELELREAKRRSLDAVIHQSVLRRIGG